MIWLQACQQLNPLMALLTLLLFKQVSLQLVVKTTTVSLKDPWGVEYSYSQGARTVACTPQDANGKAMNQIIKSF